MTSVQSFTYCIKKKQMVVSSKKKQRTFQLVGVVKPGQDMKDTKFDSVPQVYKAGTPSGAAKKAMTKLCSVKNIKGQCTLNVEVQEAGNPTAKIYAYFCKRTVNPDFKEASEYPSKHSFRYVVTAKKITHLRDSVKKSSTKKEQASVKKGSAKKEQDSASVPSFSFPPATKKKKGSAKKKKASAKKEKAPNHQNEFSEAFKKLLKGGSNPPRISAKLYRDKFKDKSMNTACKTTADAAAAQCLQKWTSKAGKPHYRWGALKPSCTKPCEAKGGWNHSAVGESSKKGKKSK